MILPKGINLLPNPESRPTANRLESLLKATESTAGSLGASIGGRVFILTCVTLVQGPGVDGYK